MLKQFTNICIRDTTGAPANKKSYVFDRTCVISGRKISNADSEAVSAGGACTLAKKGDSAAVVVVMDRDRAGSNALWQCDEETLSSLVTRNYFGVLRRRVESFLADGAFACLLDSICVDLSTCPTGVRRYYLEGTRIMSVTPDIGGMKGVKGPKDSNLEMSIGSDDGYEQKGK